MDLLCDQLWDYCVSVYRAENTGLFYSVPVKDVAPASMFIPIERYKSGDYRTQPYKEGDEKTVGYNSHGGGAGTQDCSLYTGTMLGAACDQYIATGDKELCGKKARQAYKGLCCTALVHGQPGFIARGVCPEDGKSIFAGSSRDQFTNCIYGLWRFYHSGLAVDEEKETIKKIFVGVAEKMIREITPERNYSFDFAYGVPDDRGVAKMYDPEKKSLVLRLVMFYLAAYDVTKEEKYYSLAEKYFDDCFAGMTNWGEGAKKNPWSAPTYVVLQQGYAMRLVHDVMKDEALKKRMEEAGRAEAEFVLSWEKYDLNKCNARSVGEIVNGLLQTPGVGMLREEVIDHLRKKLIAVGPTGKGYPDSNYNVIGAWWAYRAAGGKDSE